MNRERTGQLQLPFSEPEIVERAGPGEGPKQNSSANRIHPGDQPFHDWYRFVLSFPPHLVSRYIMLFQLDEHHTILDPFCGTGTTLVQAKLEGVRAVGVEANPFAHFAATVKTDWSVDPNLLLTIGQDVARATIEHLREQGFRDDGTDRGGAAVAPLRALDSDAERLLLSNSISPMPLHKTLVLLDHLAEHRGQPCYRHALLALAKALVFRISNLKFGPEVGVGQPKADSPVVPSWISEVRRIASDLRIVESRPFPESAVHLGDAREIDGVLEPNSIDAVITSPPYPNEKDYSRTTRLESVVLGFIRNRQELRDVKKTLIRSNTRGVYKEDVDHEWVERQPEIQRIAEQIEQRRKELGKTSGFERLYHMVTRHYFGGMARHLAGLRRVLRPGARLAYVVGDQASYLRVMIRTGKLLAEIAQDLGYEVLRVDLFRTRFATATKEQLREEVVVLRWPGA